MRDYMINFVRFVVLHDKTPIEAIRILTEMFDRREITREEYLALLDTPRPTGVRLNAPGGAC